MQAPKWLGECGNYLGVRAGGPETVLDAGVDYYAPNGGIEEDAAEPEPVEYFPDVVHVEREELVVEEKVEPPPPPFRFDELPPELPPEIEEVIEVEELVNGNGNGYRGDCPSGYHMAIVGDTGACVPDVEIVDEGNGAEIEITPEIEEVIAVEEVSENGIQPLFQLLQNYEITDPDTGETRIIRVPSGTSPPPGARAVKGKAGLPGWLIPALLALAMAL